MPHEKLSGWTLALVVLAMVGVAILDAYRGGESSGTTPTDTAQALPGDASMMGAVLYESIYVILSWRLAQVLHVIEVYAYTHLIGGLLMLPLGLTSLLTFDLSGIPLSIWGLMPQYALSANIFSFRLWMKDIRYVPAHLTSMFTSVLPITVATYDIVTLDETPGWLHGIALACVVAGILTASWLAWSRHSAHHSRMTGPLDPFDPSLDHE